MQQRPRCNAQVVPECRPQKYVDCFKGRTNIKNQKGEKRSCLALSRCDTAKDMLIQDAYDVLYDFLRDKGAGLAEWEALKAFSARIKSIQTREANFQRQSKSRFSQPARFDRSTRVPYDRRQQAPRPVEQARGVDLRTSAATAHTVQSSTDKKGLWSHEEELALLDEFEQGLDGFQIAEKHGRTVEAIAARLQKLGRIKHRDDLPGYVAYRDGIERQRGRSYYPRKYQK